MGQDSRYVNSFLTLQLPMVIITRTKSFYKKSLLLKSLFVFYLIFFFSFCYFSLTKYIEVMFMILARHISWIIIKFFLKDFTYLFGSIDSFYLSMLRVFYFEIKVEFILSFNIKNLKIRVKFIIFYYLKRKSFSSLC